MAEGEVSESLVRVGGLEDESSSLHDMDKVLSLLLEAPMEDYGEEEALWASRQWRAPRRQAER